MSGHKTLADYVTTVRSMTPETFAARMGHPFLCGQEVLEEEFRFRTVVTDDQEAEIEALRASLNHTPTEAQRAGRRSETPMVDRDDDLRIREWVIAVRKVPAAPAQDRVFLGRSATNDLCIPHKTVSKLHAYLQRESAPSSRWFVVDAASANGTFHNGVRLAARAKTPLLDGDTLTFGRCVFRWLTARSLYDRVVGLRV
jgi:hypothetical protein